MEVSGDEGIDLPAENVTAISLAEFGLHGPEQVTSRRAATDEHGRIRRPIAAYLCSARSAATAYRLSAQAPQILIHLLGAERPSGALEASGGQILKEL